MYGNTPQSGKRKESLPCQTKKRSASSVVLLKRTRGILPSFTMSLLSRTALPSAPLASRPASIRRGIQVFTSARIGMSGSKDFLEGERAISHALQEGNHELASMKLASSFSLQTLIQDLAPVASLHFSSETLCVHRRDAVFKQISGCAEFICQILLDLKQWYFAVGR